MAKMAMLRAFMGFTTIGALIQVATGASFAVGGASGSWDLNTDLGTWASSQTFNPGDSLTFTYTSLHTVLEVSKADYNACRTSNPLSSDSSGSTVIRLSAPGKRYFICSTPGHCDGGMKVEINTVAAATATPPRALVAAPPPASLLPPSTKSSPVKSPARAPTPLMEHHGHHEHSASPLVAPSEAPSTQSVPPPASPAGSTLQQSAAYSSGSKVKTAVGLGIGMLMTLAL